MDKYVKDSLKYILNENDKESYNIVSRCRH